MGRLSDMYGGKRLFVIGVGWLVICSIVAGVAQTELMLDIARALQGLGPAAFLPSSVMLMGSVYRPGPRKNLVSASPHPAIPSSGDRKSVRRLENPGNRLNIRFPRYSRFTVPVHLWDSS